MFVQNDTVAQFASFVFDRTWKLQLEAFVVMNRAAGAQKHALQVEVKPSEIRTSARRSDGPVQCSGDT